MEVLQMVTKRGMPQKPVTSRCMVTKVAMSQVRTLELKTQAWMPQIQKVLQQDVKTVSCAKCSMSFVWEFILPCKVER